MKSSMMTALAGSTRQVQASLQGRTESLSAADISQIISFSRISLIVGLVFLHYDRYPNLTLSPFNGMNTEAFQLATFINSFVLFFFFSVVPLLSMVSGWLFFSFETNVRQACFTRIGRRFKSLYLPLVLWNLLYLALLWLLFTVDAQHPLLSEMNLTFGEASPLDYINAVFGLTDHPIGFQFWFVRDLFVSILVSPLLWLMLRYIPWISALALGLVWLSDFDLWIFFRTDVVFFFFLGGLLRMRKESLTVNISTALALLGLYVILVAARTFAPYFVEGTPFALDLATRAMRLIGVVACWGVFQYVAVSRWGGIIARYGGFAFFLHALHYPLLAAIKIELWALVPAETDTWMLVHYAVSVIVTVAIGIAAGLALNRFAPNSFAFLNGGRLVP